MIELWMPGVITDCDSDNIFDSMIAHQRDIDSETIPARRINAAQVALDALQNRFGDIRDRKLELSLSTEIAIVDSTSKKGHYAVVKKIGMIGSIDKLGVIEVPRFQIPISLSLRLDIESVFHPEDPDDSDILLAYGNVPLNRVEYIEYSTQPSSF